MRPGSGQRLFLRLLAARAFAGVALIALTAAALAFAAARLRPDFSIESIFPTRDPARLDFDRYRADFPFDDARALVVVEAPDLATPAGLERLRALERDLARLPHVIDTDGLASTLDVVATRDADTGEEILSVGRLFPATLADPAEIARRARAALDDPLFRWTLISPDGRATTIRLQLDPATARSDLGRAAFLRDARVALATHAHEGQRLTLSGLPATRARYAELIGEDMAVLMPLALAVTALLLAASFRAVVPVVAGLVTIACACAWTLAACAALGYPMHLLTQLCPIVVMIVSVSDTSHIVDHYQHSLRAGLDPRAAVAAAAADSAIPCLITEVVIALGFLGLLAQDIAMIDEFGIVTALGMLLTWLANVTVLPLLLDAFRPRAAAASGATTSAPAAGPGFLAGAVERALAWVDRVGRDRPRAIASVTLVLVAAAAVAAPRVGREYYAFDDLDPDSDLARDIRYVEGAHGGVVPLAVLIEPGPAGAGEDRTAADRAATEDAMLEPAAVALGGRIAAFLEQRLDLPQAGCLADALGKFHRSFVGADAARDEPLPATPGAAAQEVLWLDRKLTRDFLSADGARQAVVAMAPDRGSTWVSARLRDLRAYLDEEERATGYKLSITGSLAMADGVYRHLVVGLAGSLGLAVLVSLATFAAVLRSLRLGLLALIPNVLPLLFTLATMAALDIDLKPSTVVIFSIALVIADDDTIQFLVRWRRRFLERGGAPHEGVAGANVHGEVASETLLASGKPMLLTAGSVSAGFLVLLGSRFTGLRYLGLLVGTALIAAVIADLFLTPLLLRWLRPRVGGRASGGGDGSDAGSMVEGRVG